MEKIARMLSKEVRSKNLKLKPKKAFKNERKRQPGFSCLLLVLSIKEWKNGSKNYYCFLNKWWAHLGDNKLPRRPAVSTSQRAVLAGSLWFLFKNGQKEWFCKIRGLKPYLPYLKYLGIGSMSSVHLGNEESDLGREYFINTSGMTRLAN